MALQYILSLTSTCNYSCLIFILSTEQYKNIKAPPPHQKSKVKKIQLKTISLKRLYDRRHRRGSLRGWGGANFQCFQLQIPLAPRGVLAPVSVHAGPSAQPPSALAEFFRHTCLQSCLQTSPPTPQKSYPKIKTSTTSLSGCF